MYESPIKLVRTDTLFSSTRSIADEIAEKMAKPVANEIDNYILESVRRVDVSVDREELLKALEYDRHQYDKGFEDGIREFVENIVDKYCCDGSVTISNLVERAKELCEERGVGNV